MKKNRNPVRLADATLGAALRELRESRGMTTRQLGRLVRETEQQITRFETGAAFVPITTLEALALAMDAQIPKRIIRQISNARSRNKDGEDNEEHLCELYREALALEEE